MINWEKMTWKQHWEKFARPELLTHLLQESIPLLKHIHWTVEEINEAYCRTKIPFTKEIANQFHTIQASVYLVVADYTGGIALGSLFRTLPVFGIHPVKSGYGINLWLYKSEIKFSFPLVDSFTITCKIPEEGICKIRKRFFSKRPVVKRLEINYHYNNNVVLTSYMTYYAQLVKYDNWLKNVNNLRNV